MVRLSFIVPVYNTAHLLARCLDSIKQQNLTDIEIIVINDGSPDHVDAVMQHYDDAYIHYIKQNNQGISATRNHGIQLAQGEYIMFIDSDDYLTGQHIESLLNQAQQHQLQLLRGNFTNIYLNGSHHHNPYFVTTFNAIVSGESYYTSEVLANREHMKNMPWMWLIQRQFLLEHHIYFDTQTALLEDVLFIAKCCQYAQRVSAVDVAVYYYVQHVQSSTNNMQLTQASQQILYVSEQLLQQADQVEGGFHQALKLYAGYVAMFALKIHRTQAYQQKALIAHIKKHQNLFETDSQLRQQLLKISPYLFSQYLWGIEYQQRLVKKIKQWVRSNES